MKHIAKRFALHFFVAIPVWFAVYFFAALPLSKWEHEPKILAVAVMMLVIAIREIFDASKLASIRGSILKKVAAGEPNKTIALLIMETFSDDRYTLKKSIYDLIGWSTGIAVDIILLARYLPW